MTHDEQITQRMAIAANGQAVCLDPNARFFNWIMYDNHGTWVSLRRAEQEEIERAKRYLGHLQVLADITRKEQK